MPRASVTRLLPVFVGLLFVAGACSSRDAQQESRSARTTAAVQLKTVSIPIGGMTCAVCVARVKKSLTNLDGVSEVEVSLAERHARVRYVAEKLSPALLVSTVNDLGYQAGEPVEVP